MRTAPHRHRVRRSAPLGRPRTHSPLSPAQLDRRIAPRRGRDGRRQIVALQAEGIADAEALVRRDRDGLLPAIATRRLEERLAALVAGGSSDACAAADGIIRRVVEILSADGGPDDGPLPGWALVEVAPGDQPTDRRIDLSE